MMLLVMFNGPFPSCSDTSPLEDEAKTTVTSEAVDALSDLLDHNCGWFKWSRRAGDGLQLRW